MTPLINQFTKTLRPCSGCGEIDLSDPIYDQFWKTNREENMQYQIMVLIDANDVKEAVNKIPDGMQVLAVNPRPQQQQQGTIVSGGRTSGPLVRSAPVPPNQ